MSREPDVAQFALTALACGDASTSDRPPAPPPPSCSEPEIALRGGAGTWGDIARDARTQHDDASFTGGPDEGF